MDVFITEGPGNATTAIGQSVTFCCSYIGTHDLPLWKINGTLYLSSDLPYGHRFTLNGLKVKARGQLNHTVYRCAVSVYIKGHFIKVQSPPGFLTVFESPLVNTSKMASMLLHVDITLTFICTGRYIIMLEWMKQPEYMHGTFLNMFLF